MRYTLHIFLLFFIYCFVLSKHVFAQQPLNQVNIVSFSIKNKLPLDISSWDNNQSNFILVAQKLPQVQLQSVKLVIQLKLAGTRLCGNTAQTAIAMDAFSVRNFTAGEIVSMLAQCPKLASNAYTLCAQFFNIDNYPISREFCRDFMVGDALITYTASQNISPANEKIFDPIAAKLPITFRWTTVIPKPKDPVMYKLRVWQLMQGQTGVQAAKANDPLIEKEVKNITQSIVTNIITGPCKPPYLCDFVWNVQALDKEGKPIGNKDGMSDFFSFSIKQNEWEHIKLVSPENKKVLTFEDNEVLFKWTPFIPKPNNPVVYKLRIWQILKGQSFSQTYKNSKPFITKYIESVEMVSLKNIISSKCLPTLTCTFFWTVQALGADGNPLDENYNNISEFSIK